MVVGDELSIGNLKYRVQLDAEEAAGEEAPPFAKPVKATDSQIEGADSPIPLCEPGDSASAEDDDQVAAMKDSDDALPLATEEADENKSEDEELDNTHKPDSSWLKIPDEVRLAPSSDSEIDAAEGSAEQ